MHKRLVSSKLNSNIRITGAQAPQSMQLTNNRQQQQPILNQLPLAAAAVWQPWTACLLCTAQSHLHASATQLSTRKQVPAAVAAACCKPASLTQAFCLMHMHMHMHPQHSSRRPRLNLHPATDAVGQHNTCRCVQPCHKHTHFTACVNTQHRLMHTQDQPGAQTIWVPLARCLIRMCTQRSRAVIGWLQSAQARVSACMARLNHPETTPKQRPRLQAGSHTAEQSPDMQNSMLATTM